MEALSHRAMNIGRLIHSMRHSVSANLILALFLGGFYKKIFGYFLGINAYKCINVYKCEEIIRKIK